MIALGLTPSGAPAPPGLTLQSLGDLSLVLATQPQAATARDRLALQVAAASHLSAFLPLSPARPVGAETTAAWATSRLAEIRTALRALDGSCQTMIDLAPLPSAAPIAPRDWLRQRAARHTAAQRFARSLAPLARDLRTNVTAGNARIAMLVDRSGQADLARHVKICARDLAGSGWSAVLSGPWPALCFHAADLS